MYKYVTNNMMAFSMKNHHKNQRKLFCSWYYYGTMPLIKMSGQISVNELNTHAIKSYGNVTKVKLSLYIHHECIQSISGGKWSVSCLSQFNPGERAPSNH
jgi:hypothetical protein